jgi:hypothetical protein
MLKLYRFYFSFVSFVCCSRSINFYIYFVLQNRALHNNLGIKYKFSKFKKKAKNEIHLFSRHYVHCHPRFGAC